MVDGSTRGGDMKNLFARFERKPRIDREAVIEAIYLFFVQLANIEF